MRVVGSLVHPCQPDSVTSEARRARAPSMQLHSFARGTAMRLQPQLIIIWVIWLVAEPSERSNLRARLSQTRGRPTVGPREAGSEGHSRQFGRHARVLWRWLMQHGRRRSWPRGSTRGWFGCWVVLLCLRQDLRVPFLSRGVGRRPLTSTLAHSLDPRRATSTNQVGPNVGRVKHLTVSSRGVEL